MAPLMSMEIFSFEQGTPEWFAARLGIPTASMFKAVLAKGGGKTRKKYLHDLAGERITGKQMEGFLSDHTQRGNDWEAEARETFASLSGLVPVQVGFIKNGRCGCSPDSLIGETSGLEIKTTLPHIQNKRLTANKLPPEYKAQVQGCLMITERETWEFFSYCRVELPLRVTVHRDEEYIKILQDELERFNDELVQTLLQI